MTIKIAHDVKSAGPAPAALAAALDALIARRAAAPLDEAEEARRKGSRDILRNGVYKPGFVKDLSTGKCKTP